jgi:hypothetical protein
MTTFHKILGQSAAVVGVYNTHTAAETAIKEPQRSGFDMKKLSIMGKVITPKSMSSATIMRATA